MRSLKVYYTSDVHGYLFPTDYVDQSEQDIGLLKVIENFIKDENTLIMDGGDLLQGSPYINYFQNKATTLHGITETMNKAGYDYMTLGNHDFNYGFSRLQQNLAKLNAKVTAVNVVDLEGKMLFPSYVRVLKNGLRVGIVGMVTDYINVWEKKEYLAGLKILSPLVCARKEGSRLRKQVDILIGLYHGGFERDLQTGKLVSETTENVGFQLAQELDFDLLLTGHQHTPIAGKEIFGTYIVQPPSQAKQYVKILVQERENSKFSIQSELRTPRNDYDRAFAERLQPLENEVQTYLNRPLACLSYPILEVPKLELAQKGNGFIELVGEVQLLETGADITVVSMTNTSQKLPQKICVRDILRNYPFDNTLFVLKISGQDLRASLERTAEYFALTDHGDLCINPSWLKPKIEHYNYDFFIGIVYKLDISQPMGKRVVELSFRKQAVQDDDQFTLALNHYRAFGGGEYNHYRNAQVVSAGDKKIQDLLISYLERRHFHLLPQRLDFSVVHSS